MAALEHFATTSTGDRVAGIQFTGPIGRVVCGVAGSSNGERKGRPVTGSRLMAIATVVVGPWAVGEGAGPVSRDGSPP